MSQRKTDVGLTLDLYTSKDLNKKISVRVLLNRQLDGEIWFCLEQAGLEVLSSTSVVVDGTIEIIKVKELEKFTFVERIERSR